MTTEESARHPACRARRSRRTRHARAAHDGSRALQHVNVRVNENVTKGQKIGSMAETTNDGKNLAILHFELRKGTKSVDPELYLK